MKITLQTTDKVNGVLTAVVEPEDYQGKVKDAIKKLKKEMNMPGFRKGMVPEGLIRKKYGISILGEEVNKVLSEELYKYIRENKVNMLGELLPREENNKVELIEGSEMKFAFDIALAPEFEVELTGKDKVPFYQVSVDDKTVEGQVEIYRQRGGSYEKMEEYADNDMVKGSIVEVDEKGGEEDGEEIDNGDHKQLVAHRQHVHVAQREQQRNAYQRQVERREDHADDLSRNDESFLASQCC